MYNIFRMPNLMLSPSLEIDATPRFGSLIDRERHCRPNSDGAHKQHVDLWDSRVVMALQDERRELRAAAESEQKKDPSESSVRLCRNNRYETIINQDRLRVPRQVLGKLAARMTKTMRKSRKN